MRKYLFWVLAFGTSILAGGCATTSTTMSTIGLSDSIVLDTGQKWDYHIEYLSKAEPRSWIHAENVNAGVALVVGGLIGAAIQSGAEDQMDKKVTETLLQKYNLDEKEVLKENLRSTFYEAKLPELNYVENKKAGGEGFLLVLKIKRNGVRLIKEGDEAEGDKLEAFIEAEGELLTKGGKEVQWKELFLVTSRNEYVLEEIVDVYEEVVKELMQALSKKVMYSLKYPS